MARAAATSLTKSAQLTLFDFTGTTALKSSVKYPVTLTPEITEMLLAGAPVCVGVSGGKDSSAVAIRLNDYLNEMGHTGPRLLIHADLGVVEWKDSLPVCRKLAVRLGWELVVVQRAAGDMMDRWEKRWRNNVERYENLSCVRLILPWSTPSMRFCTSELKTAVICSHLKKLFPNQSILSVTGIRHAESRARSKMSCSQVQPKLSKKGVTGINWNPIIEWPTEDVYSFLDERNEPLHEAYTIYGLTRVSCVWCIMSSIPDMLAAATCRDNDDLYRRMVELEITSTFAFQGSRWLGDVAPQLLTGDMPERLAKAKQAAQIRINAESRLPKHLLYVAGWPTVMPTREEAALIGEVRTEVAAAMGLTPSFTSTESILARYKELIEIRDEKLAA